MEGSDVAQALVGAASLFIALFTFVMASNDRRRTADRDELKALREENAMLRRERDDYRERYFNTLEENSTLRRGNV